MVDTTETLPGGAVARSAVRAVAWSYLAWFLAKAVVLVSTAVLARLLTPDDFGVVGLATVAIAYLGILQDLGLGAALIQRRDDVDEAADTVFTLNLLLGIVLAIATLLTAPLVAGFFGDDRVEPMLRVLSITFVFEALATTHGSLLERELAFARKVVPDVGATVLKAAVAITAALLGAGAWALVAGQVAASVAVAILSWMVLPWRPSLRIAGRVVPSLARFGGAILVVDLVHAIVANLDYLVVGRVLGSAALGIYVLAYRLPELLLLGVVGVLNRVVFPAFSSVQDRPDALRRGFLATFRFVPLFVLPVGIGLVVAADPIVRTVLGDQWLEAVPVMQVIAASATVSALMVSDGDVYKATGRPGLLAGFALAKTALLIPALIIGAQHGLVWVAVAHLATTVLIKIVRTVVALRIVGATLEDVGSAIRPALLPAAVVLVVSTLSLLATGGSAPWVRLGVAASLSAAAYAFVMLRSNGDLLRHLLGLIRQDGSVPADGTRELPE